MRDNSVCDLAAHLWFTSSTLCCLACKYNNAAADVAKVTSLRLSRPRSPPITKRDNIDNLIVFVGGMTFFFAATTGVPLIEFFIFFVTLGFA